MGSASSTSAGVSEEDINHLRKDQPQQSPTTTTSTTTISPNNDNNKNTILLLQENDESSTESSTSDIDNNNNHDHHHSSHHHHHLHVNSLAHMEFDLLANKVSLSLSKSFLSSSPRSSHSPTSSSPPKLSSPFSFSASIPPQPPSQSSKPVKTATPHHHHHHHNSRKMTKRVKEEVTTSTKSSSSSTMPQVFSVLEYSLSQFEVVMLNVATFLDCDDLCHFSRVCKLFRKLESEHGVSLWQCLFRYHKVNMICLSTNPVHALRSLEESKSRRRNRRNRRNDHLHVPCCKLNLRQQQQQQHASPPSSPTSLLTISIHHHHHHQQQQQQQLVNNGSSNSSSMSNMVMMDDDVLKDVSSVMMMIGGWKEACLRYVFVKRKLISEEHEQVLLRSLRQQYRQQTEHYSSGDSTNRANFDDLSGGLATKRRDDKNDVDDDDGDDDFNFSDSDDDDNDKAHGNQKLLSRLDNSSENSRSSTDVRRASMRILESFRDSDDEDEDFAWSSDDDDDDGEGGDDSDDGNNAQKDGNDSFRKKNKQKKKKGRSASGDEKCGGGGIGNNRNNHNSSGKSLLAQVVNNSGGNVSASNIFSLSAQMASSRVSPRTEQESELQSASAANNGNNGLSVSTSEGASTLKTSSPLTTGFFSRMSMMTTRKKSFESSPIIDADLIKNGSMELEDFGSGVSTPEMNRSKSSMVKTPRDGSSSDESSTWESDSDDADTVIVRPTPNRPTVDRTMSISAIQLEFDDNSFGDGETTEDKQKEKKANKDSTATAQEVVAIAKKDSDNDFLSKDKKLKHDSDDEDSWNFSDDDEDDNGKVDSTPVPSSKFQNTSVSSSTTDAKNRLTAFCDDDDNTDESDGSDFGSNALVHLSGNNSSSPRNSPLLDKFVKQEVLEEEALTVDDLITSLTNETRMRETYLSLSNVETQKFHSQLCSLAQKTKMDEMISANANDTMPSVTMEPNEWPTTLAFYNERKGNGIKVKIIFLESFQTPNPAKFSHPLVKQFGSLAEQMDHLYPALIIGPWLLHWNPHHSLVVPRKMTSQLMRIQSRIHKVAELFSMTLDDVVKLIAPEIVKWNMNAVHQFQSSNGINFIDRIMSVLGLGDVLQKNRIGRTLYNYIVLARQKGKTSLDFQYDISEDCYSFLKTLTHSSSTVSSTTGTISNDGARRASCSYDLLWSKHFSTHQELDRFIRQLIENDPSYTVVQCADYSLLVQFDLAFWFKHQLFPQNPQYAPLSSTGGRRKEQQQGGEDSTIHHNNQCPCGTPQFQ